MTIMKSGVVPSEPVDQETEAEEQHQHDGRVEAEAERFARC